MYVERLAFAWMEDSTAEATQSSFERKLDSFVEGDLEHATEVLSALWKIVNKEGEINVPPVPPMVSYFRVYPPPSVIQERSLRI